MCYVWEGKIERCQQCSEYDFQTLLRVIWNMEPARPTHKLIARTATNPLNQDHSQSSRHDAQIDLHRDLTVEKKCDQEQNLKHQVQPSCSRHDPPIIQRAQDKRQRTDEDQPSFSRRDAPTSGSAQHKRQKTNADQYSSSIHNVLVDGAAQHGKQGKNVAQACPSRQTARTAVTARSGQQVKDQDPLSSSTHNARSDWAFGRGRKERHLDTPSSSRHHAITDLTGEDEDQGTTQKTSQTHSRIEDMEVLTAGMNKLPPPCWGDERVMHPLVQQQLRDEEFFEHQKQEIDDIWAMYGKEREALAASHTPEPDETWTPVFQEEEILEREIPLQEEIWARSVLEGGAWMRNILDEGESGPQEPREEVNIWTREDGGILSAAVLKRLSRIFTLQASLEGETLQGSDECDRFYATLQMKEGDEVTQSFSEVSTSAAYPPLASQPSQAQD